MPRKVIDVTIFDLTLPANQIDAELVFIEMFAVSLIPLHLTLHLPVRGRLVQDDGRHA
jgi:hypothetical protein